ncbi:MAG: hypothetical protein AAB691_01830 [Patescibacteria group bacterium]
MPRTKKNKKAVVKVETLVTEEIALEVREGRRIGDYWEQFSRWGVLVALFFLPTLFIPGTVSIAFIIQETVFGILILLSLLCLLIDMLQKRRRVFPRAPRLLYGILGIGILGFIASFFLSPSHSLSFWGNGYAGGITALTVLLASILFFLVSQLFEGEDDLRALLTTIGLSILLSSLFTLGTSLLISLKRPVFDIGSSGFNLLGSINAFALFSGFGFLLSLSLLSFFTMSRGHKAAVIALGTLSFISLVLFGNPIMFAVLILSLLLTLGIWMKKVGGEWRENRLKLNTLLFCIIVFSLILFSGYQFGNWLGLPSEVTLSFSASGAIAVDTLKSGVLAIFFGSGPNTYMVDYSRFKPAAINLTSFWNTSFESSYSLWLTLLPTTGIIVTLALLIFIVAMLGYGFRNIWKKKHMGTREETESILLILASYLFLGSLVYSSTLTLLVYLFLVLGLLLGHLFPNDGERMELRTSRAFLSTLGVTASTVLSLILVFFLGERVMAFAEVNRNVISFNDTNDLKAIEGAAYAYQLFPHENIARVASSLWFSSLSQSLKETVPDKIAGAQSALNSSIGYAEEAIRLNRVNPDNWALLGDIYRNVLSADGALAAAIQSYEEAEKISPRNPIYPLFLSQLRMIEIRNSTSTNPALPALAEMDVRRALSIKQDLPDAYLVLAQVEELKKNSEGVITALEAVATLNPQLVEARYMLADAYERAGKIVQARKEFEALEKLIPDSKEILDRLKRLQVKK